jgi:hypothetical protein
MGRISREDEQGDQQRETLPFILSIVSKRLAMSLQPGIPVHFARFLGLAPRERRPTPDWLRVALPPAFQRIFGLFAEN